MSDEKKYEIVISTGNSDDEYLVAEIYTPANIFIASVNYDGTDVFLDYTCQAENEVCKSERKIRMMDFIDAVNESLKALELHFSIEVIKKPGV